MKEQRIQFHKRVLRMRRSSCVRIEHWLDQLQAKNLVHDNVMVFEIENDISKVAIGTVDPGTQEVGCALCGLFAASAKENGGRLEKSFKWLHVSEVPKSCPLPPTAVLYCDECLQTYRDYIFQQFNVRPTE